MKKRIIPLTIAFVLILGTLYVGAKSPIGENLFEKMGIIEKENATEESIYARSDDIIIYNKNINNIVDTSELSSQICTKDSAFKIIARREVLKKAAKENGFSTSKSEVDKQILKERTMAEQADNYNDALEFIKGKGQTIDEYWASQTDRAKEELTVQKYLDVLKEKLKNENPKLDDDEFEVKWQENFNQLCDDLIEKENFVVVK